MTRIAFRLDILRAAVRSAVLGFVVVLVLCLAAVALALSLAACTGSEGAAGPSAAETAVIGTWAGQVDAQGVPILLGLRLDAGKSYQVEIQAAGDLVEREKGTWRLDAGRVHFAPVTCDQADTAGGPLRPVTCEAGDDMPVNIVGDTWTVHFPSGGQLVTFELKKI